MQLAGKPASTLAALYFDAREKKEAAEAQVKDVNLTIAAIEQELWEAFEREDLSSLKLGNGKTVSVFDQVSVKVEDKAAFTAWVREQGMDGLLTIHANTASALVKERVTAGEDVPPGCTIGTFKQTRLR